MTSPSRVEKSGSGQLRWLAVILGLTAAFIFMVLSIAGGLSVSAKHPHPVSTAPITFGHADGKAAQPVTKPIVPAKAIDPDPTYFIGTGDGSAGNWTGP